MQPLEAWLVNTGMDQWVAFSSDSIVAYSDHVHWQEVPLAPVWCNKTTERDGKWVAIIDLIALRAPPPSPEAKFPVLFLQSFQASGGRQLALRVEEPPKKIVFSEQDYDTFLIQECGLWRFAAISGVTMDGVHIPIIDPRYMHTARFITGIYQFVMSQLPLKAG